MRVPLFSIAPVLWVLLSACGSEPAYRADPAGSDSLFRDARAYCDGNAAITDWLVVFGADTDSVVDEVVVWVEQGSASSSSFRLLDRQGGWDWYGEVWEDDMGVMDCDAHGTYVFQAWAGTVSETIYLDF